ncbi:IS1595 family transposase [Erythrobacter sp. SCSIO 43205]|uniref:IS1595 family transposase n=1 Tax=Erythrobacter sp. SCSIO 43205 TaxID=2779361 RepID=UPI001CAA15C8|nr:IS1595 family transposase [Erythrobacter sp. SCSIO 43205]UAB78935.1 IS1595 family transposase [Erythrobacter sp. SCSIO 43205]
MAEKAVSAAEFFARFPDELACLHHIQQTKYGSHTPCPRCGQFGRWTYIRGTKKFRHTCRKQISTLAGTPFYRSNISLHAVFYAILLFVNSSHGVHSSLLRKHLGLGTKTAHRLGNLIRMHMASLQPLRKLGNPSDPVAIDEVYLRYFRDNKFDALQPKILLGLAHCGQVQCGFIENRTQSELERAVSHFVHPGSRVMTDQWVGYANLRALGFRHSWVNHSEGTFYRNGVSTVEIDTCWAVFRRSLRLYGQIGAGNAWLYLAEMQLRYNFRGRPREAFEFLISNWPAVDGKAGNALRARFEWNAQNLALG